MKMIDKGDVTMKQCPACKKAYDDNTMFCKECGVALGTAVKSNVQQEYFSSNNGIYEGSDANRVRKSQQKYVPDKGIKKIFGKQRATIDAREITDVHVKKKFSAVSIMMILGGLATLASSDSLIWGHVLVVVRAIPIKTKYYVITHRRGSVNIPSDAVDGSEGQEFLDYITKYSPYAVKTDLSLGR